MKERLKKIVKVISIILTIVCITSLIYTVIFNLKENCSCFFRANISEVVTIVFAVIFAYYYVELRNDGRKQKEVIENNVKKIQQYIILINLTLKMRLKKYQKILKTINH